MGLTDRLAFWEVQHPQAAACIKFLALIGVVYAATK